MPDPSDLTAVVAHSLLGPVMACHTAATTLRDRGEALTEEVQVELLRLIADRAETTTALLRDVMSGGSAPLLDALDALSR